MVEDPLNSHARAHTNHLVGARVVPVQWHQKVLIRHDYLGIDQFDRSQVQNTLGNIKQVHYDSGRGQLVARTISEFYIEYVQALNVWDANQPVPFDPVDIFIGNLLKSMKDTLAAKNYIQPIPVAILEPYDDMLAQLCSTKEAIVCLEEEADITTAAVQRAIEQQSWATLRAPALHPSVHPYTSSYAQAFNASYPNNNADQYDQGWNEIGDKYPQPFSIQPTAYAVSAEEQAATLWHDPMVHANTTGLPESAANAMMCRELKHSVDEFEQYLNSVASTQQHAVMGERALTRAAAFASFDRRGNLQGYQVRLAAGRVLGLH